MEPITHVLFDFFGTLVHYSESRVEQDHAGSYRLLCAEGYSANYAEFLASWSASFDSFEAAALGNLEEFSMTEVCNAYLTATLHRTPSAALQHLERMAVRHLFQAVVTSVEHRRRKPSACIFQHALGKTGGHAGAAVYIGDSYAADYVGATEAGLRCLLIDPQQVHAIPEAARLSTILEVASALRA
jgi:putative hydrolase of the HAD superfamily